MPDADGYPTEEELKTIREWPLESGELAWFDFIHSCWWQPDFGWNEADATDDIFERKVHRYWLSTGGWSGNEEIIAAMTENSFMWLFTWVQSRRGGHYIFEHRKEHNPLLTLESTTKKRGKF